MYLSCILHLALSILHLALLFLTEVPDSIFAPTNKPPRILVSKGSVTNRPCNYCCIAIKQICFIKVCIKPSLQHLPPLLHCDTLQFNLSCDDNQDKHDVPVSPVPTCPPHLPPVCVDEADLVQVPDEQLHSVHCHWPTLSVIIIININNNFMFAYWYTNVSFSSFLISLCKWFPQDKN